MHKGSLDRVWVSELHCSYFLIKLFCGTPSIASWHTGCWALN